MSDLFAKPFVLVDGSYYLFRAFHAMPPLVTAKGQPTGAIFGVINMLRKLLSEFEPNHIAIIFDSKEKNFRHDIFPEYKANRAAMPEELQAQIEGIFEFIRAMGLPLVSVPGVEADDVIATLARIAEENGLKTVISTGDKDMAQIVNESIILINPMTGERLDRAGVINKFKVPPERMLDYLVLIGDAVDNVAGVPKVGPKTAVKWLDAYGNLEGIIEHQAEIKGQVGENLRAFVDKFPISMELITLRDRVELALTVPDLIPQTPNQVRLRELCREFEFKSWLKTFEESAIDSTPPQKVRDIDYEQVTDWERLEYWLAEVKRAALTSFDTETTGLDYMSAQIVGFSLCVDSGKAAYIPLAHNYLGAPLQLPRDEVLERFKPWLENPQGFKVGHNLKYDLEILANHGISLKGIKDDTLMMSYVWMSIDHHDFDSVAMRHLNYKTVSFEEVAGKGQKQICFDKVPVEIATQYAAEDADITLQIYRTLQSKMATFDGLNQVYRTIELPLIPILARMERLGILIDVSMLRAQSVSLSARLKELEDETYTLAGSQFNLNSPKQLQEILFERLKLPQLQKTPKGQPSTSESVLQELALNYPLPKLILEYRTLAKLKSTYTDKLPEQVDETTGRVHTSYHQAITATGRLSSSDPNLQNIPIRTSEGRKIRTAFIAPQEFKIVSADYSQIELRIMAHLSQDANLLKAFEENKDIHSATAAEIFSCSLDKVTANQRRDAKAINFGLIYGMSAFGLARTLNISRNDAERYMGNYFERFPGVKHYMETTRLKAAELGYVETLFGRRLYLPELKSRVPGKQKGSERAAINAPMQGSAADIIKLAMIKLDPWLLHNSHDVRMIMQVHDELVFEVRAKVLDETLPHIVSSMQTAAQLDVPLLVDIGFGDNWEEAH